MERLAAALGKRPRLAASLFAAGGAAVVLALAANALGVAASSAFGWKKATLLIAGCDLIVAALIASARRAARAGDTDGDFASLLSGAIADGVMMFAISAATVIVLFGQSKPIERLGYVLAILVIVPLSVTLAWRRQRAGATGEHRQLLAFATLAATAGVLCLDAAVAEASVRERLRKAARRIAQLVAASLFGLLAFTLLTRMATGAWANWGGYLDYIRLYTTGGFGALPIAPWSPGLALGAMYTVSAITIVLLALTRPALVRERAVAFRAATGLTVLGALVYTYFLGRAAPNNLIHISPPAVALLFVWLGIVRSTFDSRVPLAIASGTAIFLGAMIVASEGGDIGLKYPRTALAAVLGSAPPLGSDLRALWHNPVVDPTAAHVAAFVSSLGSKRDNLTILLTPSVETEAALRLRMANAVGSSNPCQESLSKQGPRRVAAAVRSLRPGGIVVTSVTPQDAGELLPIEQYTFALIRARFTLQVISADGQGLQAFRMIAPVPIASPATVPRHMSTHPTTVPSTKQTQSPSNPAPICP